MIKYSLITLFTSATLFLGAFFADGVVIDHSLPNSLQPGESTIVSVNINKGEVTGFAKLQLEIPAGLTARAIKKSGASFTFSGQKAKFIWMSLPDTQEFSIEYELEANANVNGSKVISGQFSYIKENERVDYDLDPKVINIGDVLVDGDASTTSNSTESTSTTMDADVVCTRIMTQVSEGEYFVELTAENVQTDGFAKIIDEISLGFEIKEDASGESIVTIEDDRIKYVWFEKPLDQTYSVSYTLLAFDGDAKPEINGNFSFVQNNNPLEIPIVHQEMMSPRDFGGSDAIVDNTEDNQDTSSQDNDSTSTNNNAVVTNNNTSTGNQQSQGGNQVADHTDSTNSDSSSQNTSTDSSSTNQTQGTNQGEDTFADNSSVTSIPDPEQGISYKVQLAATHKYITAANFKKSHKFTDAIQTENHEGWTKFVTGSHSEYKDARDARNSITSTYKKFNGPFVTAYNSGERITVQEALMISKQKWYQ